MSKFDYIKIPDNIDEMTKIAIKRGKKLKNKSVRKKILIASVSSIVILGGGLVLSSRYPSFAQNIPILKDMMGLIQGRMEDGSLEDSTTKVNKSFSNDGLTFTVNKAWFTGNQIYMDFTIKSDKPFKETVYAQAFNDTYEGDGNTMPYILFSEWGLYIDDNKVYNLSYENPRANFIDDYTIESNFVIDFMPEGLEFSDNSNIKYKFKLGEFGESVSDAEWILDFDVMTGKESFKKFKINETKNGITLKDIEMNQTSLNLDLKTNKDYNGLFIEVKDNEGNILNQGSTLYDGKYCETIAYLSDIGIEMKHIQVSVYENLEKDRSPIAEFKVNLNNN